MGRGELKLIYDDASTVVKSLKEAEKDLTKLGEWYLDKAKTTINANDFTKANALFNAALVRSRHVRHEIDEDQIQRRIVKTYREFLVAFAKDDRMSVDDIRNEIDSHKEWVAEKRKIFKERVNDIDQNRETEQKEEVLRINMFHYTLFSISVTSSVYIFA